MIPARPLSSPTTIFSVPSTNASAISPPKLHNISDRELIPGILDLTKAFADLRHDALEVLYDILDDAVSTPEKQSSLRTPVSGPLPVEDAPPCWIW
jgi:hypothetical protein